MKHGYWVSVVPDRITGFRTYNGNNVAGPLMCELSGLGNVILTSTASAGVVLRHHKNNINFLFCKLNLGAWFSATSETILSPAPG